PHAAGPERSREPPVLLSANTHTHTHTPVCFSLKQRETVLFFLSPLLSLSFFLSITNSHNLWQTISPPLSNTEKAEVSSLSLHLCVCVCVRACVCVCVCVCVSGIKMFFVDTGGNAS